MIRFHWLGKEQKEVGVITARSSPQEVYGKSLLSGPWIQSSWEEIVN